MLEVQEASTVPGVLEKKTDGISVREAADRMGVTAATIHNWIKAGILPATKFGPSSTRIDPQDLEKLRQQA